MRPHDSDPIVRLATARNPAEAHVWEQALRDAGISCHVVGDYLDAGLGDIPGMRSEIWVHQKDLDAATKVLESRQPTGEEESSSELEA
jgi:hypothetical protein